MGLAAMPALCSPAACVAGQASLSGGSSAVRQANKGFAAGVGVPVWAVHRRVHLLPSAGATGGPALWGALSPQGLAAGSSGGPEQVEGTDRPLLYHEETWGVQHSPHVYVIFWGSAWNGSTGSALRAQLLQMYRGLSGSSYQKLLTQYFDEGGRISETVTVTPYTDTSVTAPSAVNDNTIQAEAARAIGANGWGAPFEGWFNAQLVVVPAPGSTYESNFGKSCGYHGVTSSGSYSYTFYPYVGDEPFYRECRGYDASSAADATSMIAAREYAASATDPGLNTWLTEEGYEVSDLCSGYAVEAKEGSLAGSWVAGLWDDSRSDCAIADADPADVYAVSKPGVSLGPHEIELRGVGYPEEGYSAQYSFEYGPTSSYGTSVPAEGGFPEGYLSLNERLYAVIKALPEGIYHYRLVGYRVVGGGLGVLGTLAVAYGEDRIAVSPGFSAQRLPAAAAAAGEGPEVRDVSCVPAQTCLAVGRYGSAGGHLLTAAELWSGSAWSALTAPNPPVIEGEPAGMSAELRGVSCASPAWCVAVGDYRAASGGVLTLVERWDGSEWSIQPTPNQAGAFESVLRRVSCVSATECVAVGYTDAWGTELTLAERWDGSEWSILPTPNSNGASTSAFRSVSCVSATECVAVGSYTNASGRRLTLAERWDGSEWSIQPTPNAGGLEPSNGLAGVSCTSSTACMAVGVDEHRSGSGFAAGALVERWDGAEWSIQPVPEPSSSRGSDLLGISCASSSACTAVGRYVNLAAPLPTEEVLGERWNGIEWSIIGVREPSVDLPWAWGARRLVGVSCTEPTVCVAVGDGLRGPVSQFSLETGFAEVELGPPILTTQTPSTPLSSEAVAPAAPGGGSGGPGGGPGRQGGGDAASSVRVSAVRVRGDLALVSLTCHGAVRSSCTVSLTLTVVEKLRRGRPLAVSAVTGTRLRTVILGGDTITLGGGASRLARVALNATGRRLLAARRRMLAVKLTVSANGRRLSSRILRFRALAHMEHGRRGE